MLSRPTASKQKGGKRQRAKGKASEANQLTDATNKYSLQSARHSMHFFLSPECMECLAERVV